jgi:hypothetical protein
MLKETSFRRTSQLRSSISSSNSLGSQANWQALPVLQGRLLQGPLHRPAGPNPRAATDGPLPWHDPTENNQHLVPAIAIRSGEALWTI